jgi:hypothetical protein
MIGLVLSFLGDEAGTMSITQSSREDKARRILDRSWAPRAGCSTRNDHESGRRDTMSLRDEPHYQVASTELADWLERQGTDIWWSVDGDPYLTGRISFSCPADVLAAELRRINRPLLVRDLHNALTARGQRITAQELDNLVSYFGDDVPCTASGRRPGEEDDRVLYLAWTDRGDEWMLFEDGETTAAERREAALLAQGRGE